MPYEYEDESPPPVDPKRLLIEMGLAILALAVLPPLIHYTLL